MLLMHYSLDLQQNSQYLEARRIMDKKPENIGDLGEFFNIIGSKEAEGRWFRSVVGDINLDGIFDNLENKDKEKKKKKKTDEQLEKFLFEDVDKKEEPKKEEIPEDQEFLMKILRLV